MPAIAKRDRTSPAIVHLSPARETPKLGDFTADRRVLLLMGMAVAIGSAAVAAAWMLLTLIILCTNITFHGQISLAHRPIASLPFGLFGMLVPVGGCLIIGLMARFGSEKIRGHGIPEAIEAILIGKSRISAKVAILKPLSSAISTGTGGPFGAEGPIIMTGGAIGSLLAQMIHLSSAERKTLLVAGAAAGMTAIFGTPLAAVLLAIELLLFEWKPRSFLPVVVAVVAAAAERTLIFDAPPLFPYAGHMVLSFAGALSLSLAGVIFGLGSGLLTAMVYGAEDIFHKLPIHWMWWPMFGGLVVGIGGLIDPAALGMGYDNLRQFLDGDVPFRSAMMLLVVKSIIWAIALGSGTSGGVLAPLLICGGALGTVLAPFLPEADVGFWPLLGMAAMMGGTMRAPLTATLFAIELTGDQQAALPLLIVGCTAFATTVLLLKRSILTEKIARRGIHITCEYHTDPFDQMCVKEVMTRNADTLPASWTLREAIDHLLEAKRQHKSYPMVDDENRLVGMISRAALIDLTKSGESFDQDASLADAIDAAGTILLHPDHLVSHAADRMAAAKAACLPVVDERQRLAGVVSKSDLLAARAHHRAEERDRAILLRWRRSASATGHRAGSKLMQARMAGVARDMGRAFEIEKAQAHHRDGRALPISIFEFAALIFAGRDLAESIEIVDHKLLALMVRTLAGQLEIIVEHVGWNLRMHNHGLIAREKRHALFRRGGEFKRSQCHKPSAYARDDLLLKRDIPLLSYSHSKNERFRFRLGHHLRWRVCSNPFFICLPPPYFTRVRRKTPCSPKRFHTHQGRLSCKGVPK